MWTAKRRRALRVVEMERFVTGRCRRAHVPVPVTVGRAPPRRKVSPGRSVPGPGAPPHRGSLTRHRQSPRPHHRGFLTRHRQSPRPHPASARLVFDAFPVPSRLEVLVLLCRRRAAHHTAAYKVSLSLSRHFSRVSCIFNSVTHQQTNKFCMKWREERRRVSPW
jgi:hypothetical protein